MGKPDRAKFSPPASFTDLQKEARAADEHRDCCVKMIALAARIPYAEAHALCARHGRKRKQGMFDHQWKAALKEAGVEWERVDPRHFIDQYPGNHATRISVTTHQPDKFNDVWNDGHRYIFHCRGHVAYVENGVCQDWSRGRSLRAIAILRIKSPA